MLDNIRTNAEINMLGQEKILMLMHHHENRRILQEILKPDYEIISHQKNQLPDDLFDLIILDEQGLAQHAELFRKSEISPDVTIIDVPVVLFTGIPLEKISPSNLEILDDIITIPSKKKLIKYRIDRLVKKEGRKLYLSRYIYESLSQNSEIGVSILEDNTIKYINSTFLNILEKAGQELRGKHIKEIFSEEKILNFLQESPRDNVPKTANFKLYSAEEDKWIKASLSPAKFLQRQLKMLILLDITEHISVRDGLTGLYNRKFIEEEMDRLDTVRQLPLSLIMADVNGLKLVNDTCGHHTGDELLSKVARLLQDSCRDEDLVARYGGDEFLIFLPQTTEKEAKIIYDRIKKNARNTTLEGLDIPISIALGVGVKEEIDKDIQTLLMEAENNMYDNKRTESRSVKNNILTTLLTTLGTKSHETEEHAIRMRDLAVRLGEKIGLTVSELDKLSLLASLHDIGKVTIPVEIFSKPGKLSKREWESVKRHPETGEHIASSTEEFSHISKEILSHHERWDGDGYPQGLSGEETPLLARIISIVDAYDVMTTGRPYQPGISQEEALQEIDSCAGSQFDPDLAQEFIKMLTD
ncbi:MAG: diguanylate cyclase [Bacillota bacterium]